jgi:hypothetical protein
VWTCAALVNWENFVGFRKICGRELEHYAATDSMVVGLDAVMDSFSRRGFFASVSLGERRRKNAVAHYQES